MADQTRPAGDSVLVDKDTNQSITDMQAQQQDANEKDVKSMEYHRQVFQSKMAAEKASKYVSPSDNIMSPCTAKLAALRNKMAAKAKPRSLFAQASAKRLGGEKAPGDNPFASSSDPEDPFNSRPTPS